MKSMGFWEFLKFKLYLKIVQSIKINNTLVILIILLLLSILKMPYFYYQILHWVVCIVNWYIAWEIAKKEPKNNIIWLFVVIAILFNPILPFYFWKSVWIIIDLLVTVFYIYFILNLIKVPKWLEINQIKKDNWFKQVINLKISPMSESLDKETIKSIPRTKQEIIEYFNSNQPNQWFMRIWKEDFNLFLINAEYLSEKNKYNGFNESHLWKYWLIRSYPFWTMGFVADNKERTIEYILKEFNKGNIAMN